MGRSVDLTSGEEEEEEEEEPIHMPSIELVT
jgi:hypothetical protein